MTTITGTPAYPFTASCGCTYSGFTLTGPCDAHSDPEECYWCGEPVTDASGSDWCGGPDSTGRVHPSCHYASGCRRRGCD